LIGNRCPLIKYTSVNLQNTPILPLSDKQHETLFFKLRKFSSISSHHTSPSNNKIQTIAEVFSILETNKDQLDIESYLLSETTLEQIFMSFAKSSHTAYSGISDTQPDPSVFTTFSYDSKSVVTTQTSCNSSGRGGAPPVLVSFQDVSQRLSLDESWPTGAAARGFFKKLRGQLRRGSEYEVKF